MLYNGTPIPPLKIAPSHGDVDPHLTDGGPHPWATRVLNQNSISIGLAVCAGLPSVTDR